MLTLRSALKGHFGAFWIQTHDTHRLIECIVEHNPENLYRFDAFKGLLTYQNNKWQTVTVESSEDPSQISGIWDQMQAFTYVMFKGGTFVIVGAEKVAEDLYGPIMSLVDDHRQAFINDNLEKIKSRVIFISSSNEVPAVYGRNMPVVSMPLPTVQDIENMYHKFEMHSPEQLGDKANRSSLAACSVGLSENEIITAATEMIASKGFVDAVAMNEIRISLLKSNANIDLIRPKVTFDDLGGLDIAKKIIQDSARIFADKNSNTKVRNKYLLVGVPGCGKSALCEAAAHQLDMNLARTGLTQQMSKWIGESERNMRQTLATISAMSPIAVWIEEIGRDLSGGNTTNDGGTTDRVQGQLLTGLQEMADNIFLFATANRVDKLAPEILRQGRFDEVLFVGFPSQSEREDIINIHLNKNNLNIADFNIAQISAASEGFTGSEIESTISKLSFIHESDNIAANTGSLIQLINDSTNLMIVRHNVEMKAMYQRALKEWTWASSQQKIDAQRFLSDNFGPMKNNANSSNKKVSAL